MRPYELRDSSKLRFGGFFAVLAAGFLVGVITGSLLVFAGFVAAAACLDLLVLLSAGMPARDAFRLDLSIRPAGKGGVLVAGGVARLIARVALAPGTPPFPAIVLPLQPEGVEVLGAPGAVGVLTAGDEAVVDLECRLVHAGAVVFPGVLLRRTSTLGFFARDRLVPARLEARVLPDYARTEDPVLARYFQRGETPADSVRPRALKGPGSDFAEIREYRPGDPQRRMDWKATARRGRLLVREYEEPREYTVRVILDGSMDLVASEGFARAADLVAKLAFVATAESMGLSLTVYDETVLFSRRLAGRRADFARLVAEIVALPRVALLRAAAGADLRDRAEKVYRRTVCRWAGSAPAEPLDSFLERYRPGESPDRAAFLADFDPAGLARRAESCPECGAPLFADESGCPRCGGGRENGDLAPRAACLAGVLTRALRSSRGRETLVLVSAFRGGEACAAVGDLLALAATPHRRVHVIAPTQRELSDDRFVAPGSLGSFPELARTLRDAETLLFAENFRGLTSRLSAAGVPLDSLEDGAARDGIVSRLLTSEVL